MSNFVLYFYSYSQPLTSENIYKIMDKIKFKIEARYRNIKKERHINFRTVTSSYITKTWECFKSTNTTTKKAQKILTKPVQHSSFSECDNDGPFFN